METNGVWRVSGWSSAALRRRAVDPRHVSYFLFVPNLASFLKVGVLVGVCISVLGLPQ